MQHRSLTGNPSNSSSIFDYCSFYLLFFFLCSPAPRADAGAGPSQPAGATSASSLPLAAVAFEEAAASQAAVASQAALKSLGHEDALGHDTVFDNEDASNFLQRLREAQDLYFEECKRSHRL